MYTTYPQHQNYGPQHHGYGYAPMQQPMPMQQMPVPTRIRQSRRVCVRKNLDRRNRKTRTSVMLRPEQQRNGPSATVLELARTPGKRPTGSGAPGHDEAEQVPRP